MENILFPLLINIEFATPFFTLGGVAIGKDY